YAGLAGLWIIREQRERELGLPEGPPFEVPLLIQDRNFALDAKGFLTGQLLHKTDPEVVEAFAPFTVVNGKVWPVLEVQPATYRFRVINGSNARTYRLVPFRDGKPDLERVRQIGTDHGLLPIPCGLPAAGLVLASAERADLLVDFSDLSAGAEVTLFNTASAPFDGSRFPANEAPGAGTLEGLLPYPEVMRLRVIEGKPARRAVPEALATDLAPPPAGALDSAPRRTILLVEREMEGEPNMLTLRELAPAPEGQPGSVVTISDGERTTRHRVVASHFEDAATFYPMLGQHEVWRLVNLTSDTHPIHVHLDPFWILARRPLRYAIPEGGMGDLELTATVTLERAPTDPLEHAIDENERGLKDTVRVNPNELVEI